MEVKNIQEYIKTLLENGTEPHFYKKYARVQAVKGVPGQSVTTVMKNGHVEVSGVVVKVDENGEADWLITNPDGEVYAIPHKKFVQRYETTPSADGKYVPKGAPIKAVQVKEDITIYVPWGEGGALIPMNIIGGGYLVITDPKDIYGIQEEEFKNTYAACNSKGIFYDKSLQKAFGQVPEDKNELE